MKVKVLTCGTPTPQGRIYPKELVEKEIDRINEEILKGGWMFGEFERDFSNINEMACVRFSDIAFEILSFHFDGNDLYAEINIIDSKRGKLMQEYNFENLSFNLRALGHLTNELIFTDLKIITIDATLTF